MMIFYSPFQMLAISSMIMSTIMMISSSNWLFTWMALELNLLSFIPIMMYTKMFQETEAAVKYFLAQALGSSLLMMSSLSMWSNFSMPNQMMPMILFLSLMLKAGMVPCHMWYPSVMTSISWLPALILSTWQKLGPLLLLSFMTISFNMPIIIIILSSLNAIVGGMLGMNQSHLRSIMAYSSITHMGWMLSLMYISMPVTMIYYFILYSMIITPIFLIFFIKNTPTTSNSNNLLLQSPFLQLMLPILLLSLSGLPPLTGFIPKWMVISSLSNINPMLMITLIMGAMMNTYFYLNIAFNILLSNKLSFMHFQTPQMSPLNKMSIIATLMLFIMPTIFL